MTSMMPSQQRFGAPTNNNPGQPARPRPQVGGDMQFAGGTPYFDERTGQARQPARQSGGMDMSAYRPGQAQSQQPSFGSAYNPNANERLPGNFGQPPQQNAGRQPASFGDMQFAGGTPYFDERTGQTRQPPFQMAPAQTPWGQSMDPFAERDAFVNQINQQRMQNQIAFNSGGPTNPAAGMNPGIDYQRAMQQAGLGGGAPSMAPDYGDSLIARLNQQFGGSAYQPPGNFGGLEAGMMQQFAPSRPQPPGQYVNQQGELFTGSMSFAPGTPQEYRDQAYGQYANRQGFFLQPVPAGQAFSPQPTPGFGFNEGYGFGGPSLAQPATGNQTGNASLGFQDWMRAGSPGAGQWHTMDHQTGVDATGQPMSGYGTMLSAYWRWVESQGGSRPGGGSQRPNAPPPSQGGGFKPQPAQAPAEGTVRQDPFSGKPVTYSNGQWSWNPNPVSGPQPFDVSRFGDAPPPRQPSPSPRPAEDDFFVGNWGAPPSAPGKPASRQQEWEAAGRPGYDGNRPGYAVIGTSRIDGTQFGYGAEADAYDKWLQGQGLRPGQANPVAPPSQGTPYENPFAQPGRSRGGGLSSPEQAEAMRQMQQTGITYPPGLSAKQKSAFNERIRQSQQAVAGYPAGKSGRQGMKRDQASAP